MENFWCNNKNFFGIIIGAVIIGGFVYFGLESGSKSENKVVAFLSGDKNATTIADSTIANADKQVSLPVTMSSSAPKTVCGASKNTIVTKVIDGDTVVVEGGYHVRLLGMDADEKGYTCYEPAKTRLEDLVLGKQVKLKKDKTDVDQYGRCLRYIFLGNINVDVQLVKEGLAVARFYDDVKYKTEITSAEKQAEESKTGCKWLNK
jgi:endonuclease YncB( thermonuclease family)